MEAHRTYTERVGKYHQPRCSCGFRAPLRLHQTTAEIDLLEHEEQVAEEAIWPLERREGIRQSRAFRLKALRLRDEANVLATSIYRSDHERAAELRVLAIQQDSLARQIREATDAAHAAGAGA